MTSTIANSTNIQSIYNNKNIIQKWGSVYKQMLNCSWYMCSLVTCVHNIVELCSSRSSSSSSIVLVILNWHTGQVLAMIATIIDGEVSSSGASSVTAYVTH